MQQMLRLLKRKEWSFEMAFFGMFNYSKPGPGVDKNGPQKKRFFYFFELFFRKFWKLVQLNLLFVLCCIPIVTIGPAIAGLTYVLRNFAQERPVFLVSDFFDAFKSNWKQSFVLSIVDGVVSAITGVAFFWYFSNSALSWAMAIPLGFSILVVLLLLFMRYYTYLMIVTVDLPVRYIIKNALIFCFLGIKTNLITSFFVLGISVPIALFVPFPLAVLFFLLLGCSLVSFIVTYNSYPYLVRYIIEPHEKKLREEAGEYDDEDDDEDDAGESIFTDIGTQEVAASPGSTSKGGAPKQKVIR